MLTLSSEFSSSERRVVAEALAFALLPSGEVLAIARDGSRQQVLGFRPGAARLGRPEIKDGAWFQGRQQVVHSLLTCERGSLELYGDSRLLDGRRQSGITELELDAMEGSRPFLWNERGDCSAAAVEDGLWRAEKLDSESFAVAEILLASPDLLPPSWAAKATPRLRPSAMAR